MAGCVNGWISSTAALPDVGQAGRFWPAQLQAGQVERWWVACGGRIFTLAESPYWVEMQAPEPA